MPPSAFKVEMEANETDGERAKKALQSQESQPTKPTPGTADILQATASAIQSFWNKTSINEHLIYLESKMRKSH